MTTRNLRAQKTCVQISGLAAVRNTGTCLLFFEIPHFVRNDKCFPESAVLFSCVGTESLYTKILPAAEESFFFGIAKRRDFRYNKGESKSAFQL